MMKQQTPQACVAAIGNFDGVHLGHQKILEETKAVAAKLKLKPILITFEPYPHEFFHPALCTPRLTNLREKVSFVRENFFDTVAVLKFNQAFSVLSPEKFIQNILLRRFNVQHVVVGEDFRFGHHRVGDHNTLEQYLPVHIVQPVFYRDQRISSTRIRQTLREADVETAKMLLGRRYTLTGKVVQGQQRGRLLGFPTANVAMLRRLSPVTGVYAVRVNQKFNGVANVGTRPTVQQGQKMFLEVHLFETEQNLYGQWLETAFFCKIRDEKRFASIEELKTQIHADVIIAKQFFDTEGLE